jgi:hypothetical protein
MEDNMEELDGRAVSALGVRSRKLSTGLNNQLSILLVLWLALVYR